jgi:hypothetical protein
MVSESVQFALLEPVPVQVLDLHPVPLEELAVQFVRPEFPFEFSRARPRPILPPARSRNCQVPERTVLQARKVAAHRWE